MATGGGTIKYTKSPAHVMDDLTDAMKEGLELAAGDWHRTFMPGHFAPGAGAKYNYQPRKKGYQIRKAKAVGHNIPLVYSGDSERDARSMVRLSSRKMNGNNLIRATAAMNLPKYFYQYHPGQLNKAAELTKTTASEDQMLVAIVAGTMERRANTGGKSETLTV